VFTHILSEHAHTNGGEEVDREASVLGISDGENAGETGLEHFIAQFGGEFGQAHCLHQFLKEDLDEDTR
jgi:hypothetical protein